MGRKVSCNDTKIILKICTNNFVDTSKIKLHLGISIRVASPTFDADLDGVYSLINIRSLDMMHSK